MINATHFSELENVMEYLKQVPYDVTQDKLYKASTLYEGYSATDDATFDTCYDSRVYHHYQATGSQTHDIKESLARTLHDHGMQNALKRFFETHDKLRCVGIMGGHALLRTDATYRQITLLSKRLTEQGFCMLSGGGPGAMEATHLGAWLAGRTVDDVDDALDMLRPSPSFNDEGWLASAFSVMAKYPQLTYDSLGIPTWLYGHEPSTPFATHIAKFFENSIREDSILTLAYGGIVYTPGSAGTMQEVFQDAVQNHYVSLGLSSPMIFLGTKYWTEEMPVYPLLEDMMHTGRYKNLLLTLTDDMDTIVDELTKFAATPGRTRL